MLSVDVPKASSTTICALFVEFDARILESEPLDEVGGDLSRT